MEFNNYLFIIIGILLFIIYYLHREKESYKSKLFVQTNTNSFVENSKTPAKEETTLTKEERNPTKEETLTFVPFVPPKEETTATPTPKEEKNNLLKNLYNKYGV